MKTKKLLSLVTALSLLLAFPCFADSEKKSESKLGNVITEIAGEKKDFTLKYASEEDMFADMKLVCENSSYAMYYHADSLAVGIADKKSGNKFLTNPFNAAADNYYSGEIAERLDSQIIVSYINSENVANKFYSSNDSVKLGQYSVRLCENGMRVEYSLGEEQEQLICPEILPKKEFESLISKMDENDSGKVEYFYYLADESTLSESEFKAIVSKYPIAKKESIYVLTELNKREQKTLDTALRSAGYDESRYNADLKKYNLSADKESTANIKLSLEYILTEDGLTVTIPRKSISFDENVCYLQSVDVLPYFGADSEATGDTGYLFIPDGSGAIISFANQNDTRRRIMTGRVYGYDKALDQTEYKNFGEQYYLPVFGIVRNNASAVFATIENGDTMSEITAMLGAPNSNYYSVYNTFLYTTVENVTMNAKVSSMNSAKKIYLHDDNVPDNDFAISYSFLSGDSANYSSMAMLYREKLKNDGMSEKSISQNIDIKTVGTALYEDSILGFTVKKEAKLTAYTDNIKMSEYFNEHGIDNTSFNLTGWQKYGLDSGITNKLSYSGTLGGRKAFTNMLKQYSEKKSDIYLNIDICGVRYNRTFDGFMKKRDTAKMMNGKYADLSLYDAATQKLIKKGFLVSPSRYGNFIKSFIKSADKNSITNINLTTLGVELNSDFDSGKNYNREQSKNNLTALLENVSKKHNLAFDGANAYVLPFASRITDVPSKCSEYPGETASVPFLQLAVGGCVKCISEPLNLSGVSKTMLLNCVAYGMSPSYTLAYENVEQLKLTDYTDYYAVNFETLKGTVVSDYEYVKEAFNKVDGSRLVSHNILADGVSRSTFENGTVIYVNAGKTEYAVGNIKIAAESYLVA